MARTDRDTVAPGHGRTGDRRAKAMAEARARAKLRWERETERRARICHAVELGGQDHGLSTSEIQTLQVIAVGERTWTEVEELERVGLNGPILSGLLASNWVEEFRTEAGRMVTLSTWSAEELGVDSEEKWEIHPKVIEQEDSSGEKTRSCVLEAHEVPRFESRPPPREKGIPKSRPRAIKLPSRFHFSWLPTEVILGLLPRDVPSALDEVIAREEEYLMEQARLEDGRLDVDPQSGTVREVPVVLFGSKIPRAKSRQRKPKRKGKSRPKTG